MKDADIDKLLKRMKLDNLWQRVLKAFVGLLSIVGLGNVFHALLTHLRFTLKLKQARHPLEERLIVSLTSYPPRYATLSLTLKTLLTQSIKPDLVVLWIYEADFDKLPDSVTSLAGTDLLIRKTSRDTRSYKKLLDCLSDYPSAYIATADDDIYYTRNWLKQLLAGLRPSAREIVGHRGHRITLTPEKDIRPYAQWDWRVGTEPSEYQDRVVLTGCGGILYPPNSLHTEVFNERAYIELCPSTDDLWFYFMARLNSYTCRVISDKFRLHIWEGSQAAALVHENYDGGINDVSLQKLVAAYGVPFSVPSIEPKHFQP